MALTAHWKFDDNAASTTVVATVGSNATLNGGDNTADIGVAGPGGSITAGLDLDGSADYITFTGWPLAAGSAGSVLIWLKLEATPSNFYVWGRSAGVNSSVYIANTTTVVVRPAGGSTVTNFTVGTLGTSDWIMLLVTKTAGNEYRVFINDTESSSGGQTVANAWTAPTDIGNSNGTINLNARVAWCKFFDTDESGNVATLYAEGTADVTPPEVQSITVNATGDEITVAYDEAVTGDEETGWSLTSDGGAVTISAASGSGTATHTWTPSRTILDGETITADYEDGTGNLADGAANALADVVDFAVTNNSTETGGGGPNVAAIAHHQRMMRAG